MSERIVTGEEGGFHFMQTWRPGVDTFTNAQESYARLAVMGRMFPEPPSDSEFGGLPDEVVAQYRAQEIADGSGVTMEIEVIDRQA